jgi:Xaa-Pro dipeptidase
MPFSRRSWLQAGALALTAPAWTALPPLSAEERAAGDPLPPAFDSLRPLGDRVRPIDTEEFRGRIASAQRLLRDARPALDALLLTAGSSLYYFTGIRWRLSERLFALLLPARGEPVLLCPGFEEHSARELLRWPIELRLWQEDESPYALARAALADRGLRTGRLGVEETVPFTFSHGLRRAAPAFEQLSADAVTIACRARKSPPELELMRLANFATVEVFRAVFASLRDGMSERDVRRLIARGFERMELQGGALVLFGPWAALPHGTTKPQRLREGDAVLLDGGTSVEGYAADVTRTGALGKPSEKLRRAFDAVRRAQDAALEAARAGRTCGSVDSAARAAIVAAGYPGGYEVFTHRLGHGIGLDGHEHPYLVGGSRVALQPGMTFSNEPGIYVKDDFGLRLEDIMAIEPSGPAQLLTPGFSPSLENPCG